MHIAFIVNNVAETFIINQITGLVDRGHSVDIYTDRSLSEGSVHGDIEKYGLLDRTFFIEPAVPSSKKRRVREAAMQFLKHCPRHLGPLLRSLNIVKYGRRAASLQVFFTLLPLLRDVTYDIIHSHFGPNGIKAALFRETGALKGKLVTTFHGYDVNFLPRIQGQDMYRTLFEKGDAFTYSSEFIKTKLEQLGGGGDKFLKLPNGVDLSRFPFRQRRSEAEKGVNILTVCRLVEVKGVEYALRAVSQIVNNCPTCEIRYLIVGEGPLRQELEELAGNLGIDQYAHFLGQRNQESLAQLYGDADIFLFPSIVATDGTEEGQGIALLEAQATGLPIISTKTGGIPETAVDGETGFLVQQKDAAALADRLRFLIANPEVRWKMGQAGRKQVEVNYDIDKLNDRLVEIYERLVISN